MLVKLIKLKIFEILNKPLLRCKRNLYRTSILSLPTRMKVPAEEHGISKNPNAMASVMRGLEDIKEARVSQIDRDFSEYI